MTDEEEIWRQINSRAGPSDANREEWLAFRRTGVTATQIAKLAMAPDLPFAIALLVREKITGDRAFTGNAYTDWGTAREPHLAAEAEALYGIIPESRAFHHPEEIRWLASPDGIKVLDGVIELGEYKTAGNPLTPEAAVYKGYADQCQWQMLVMGAQRTLLLWEERVEGEEEFFVGRSGCFMIEADTDRQDFLAGIADRFLWALDEATDNGLPDDDADPVLETLVADVLEKRQAAAIAEEYLRDYLELSGITAAATSVGKLSYSWGSPRRVFDRERFNTEHPGLYEEYVRDGATPEKRTLRLTPPKTPEEGT